MFNFKFASPLVKSYCKNVLHISPKTYNADSVRLNQITNEIASDDDDARDTVPGVLYTVKNSRREEQFTSEDLAFYNEYLH